MKKILSTQCKNKVHTSCDGYLEYFPHLKGYKCNCECHSVKKVKPTPPVNESWAEDLSEYAVLHSEGCCANSEGGCDVGVGPIDCCENMVMIGNFIRSVLSTARQEATLIEKEVSDSHKQLYDQLKDKPSYDAYSDDYKHGILRGYTLIARFIDSLTSKGGTNGK